MKSKSISVHDLSGKRYNFTDNLYITGGAAGKIYNVKGQPKLVAKIFKKKQSKNDSDRIREMVNDYKAGNVKLDLVWENNYKTKLGTWPIDILSDQRGNVIGYLMPKANGIELLEITENNFRKNPNYKSFSNTKNKFILCHRLAVVFSNFYKDGLYSNGDIKPQNIFIDIKGYPMILDLDNVTIKKKNKILKPKFVQFTPEYMAHDWNGDIYSDYFSIAVIFYELMFGIKPYVGSLKSGKLPRIKEKIDHRYFVHGRKKREFSVIPKPHDAFNTLPSNLQTLFHKAFDLDDKTKRPNMKEWSQAFYQYLINKKTITPTYQPNVKTTKKKRSTRKRKSTGTLFTPKTTSATATANTTTTPQKPAFNPQLFNKMRIEYWVSWLLLVIGCAYCGFTYSFLTLMVILGVWLSYYVNYLNKRSIKYFGIPWNKLLKQNQKNKKTNLYIGLSLITVIALICSYIWFTKEPVKTSNIVGTWIYYDTQFDEYDDDIEHWVELEIIRVSEGQYKYEITGVMDDLRNDRFDKRFYTNGEFKKWIRSNQWRFDKPISGNEPIFGGRSKAENAYIEIPPDHWDNYKPSSITVAFDKNRELLMFFRDRFYAKNLKGKRQRD